MSLILQVLIYTWPELFYKHFSRYSMRWHPGLKPHLWSAPTTDRSRRRRGWEELSGAIWGVRAMAVGTSQPTVKMLKVELDYHRWSNALDWGLPLALLLVTSLYSPVCSWVKKHLIDMIHTVYILICYRPILGLRGAHYLDLVKVRILRFTAIVFLTNLNWFSKQIRWPIFKRKHRCHFQSWAQLLAVWVIKRVLVQAQNQHIISSDSLNHQQKTAHHQLV